MPRSSSAEYFKSRFLSLKKKTHLTQKYEVQYTGNMPRSESPDGKQPINRNMKLHNVSYQRSLSQIMSAFLLFYWQSICRVVRELKSFRRATLPSQLSESYWIKNNNNNNKNVHFLQLVNFTEFRPFCIRY